MSRAFTLVELLVTLVIVGLILGLTVPRVATLGGRGASAEAEALAGLLSSAAGRSAVASQPLRVRAEPKGISIERRELERSGSQDVWVWQQDPFMPSVKLNRGSVAGVFVDGQAIGGSPWIAELGAGRSVEVTIVGADRQLSVTLMPGALRAVVIEGERVIEAPGRVDLDASGLESTPW